MKKASFIVALFTLCALSANAQNTRVIDIEKLDVIPVPYEPVMSYEGILQSLISSDNFNLLAKDANNKPAFNIVARSKISEKLVTFKYNSFFDGMYFAYANHRPFTLSPDMIWLLISQGFANHVANNAETLRSMFVGYNGKTDLIVINNKIKLEDPNSPWEEVFPEFSKQIAKNTGQQLTDAITADFSTTTPVTKMASQITLLKAMSAYFEYNVWTIGCGIPSVTLEGTTKDWENVLAKAEALRKYKLDWWIDALEPELKQFIAASKGEVDKDFWKSMFKIHEQGRCGSPTIIDGWIVKFYPYYKNGNRSGLKDIAKGMQSNLPDEILKTDLKYTFLDGAGHKETTPLELWAGFVGLDEDAKTFNLKPRIGWMIRKKDKPGQAVTKVLNQHRDDAYGIDIRVSTVPPELMQIGPIKKLSIWFTGDILIPDEMAAVKIDRLILRGKIEPKELDRVVKMFPNTGLYVNGQEYNLTANKPAQPGLHFN